MLSFISRFTQAKLSIMDIGMLSTDSEPTSSKIFIAVVLPAPDPPVIMINWL